MSIQSILLPVVAQVFLTFVMYVLTAVGRTSLLRKGAVRWQDISLRSKGGWPETVQKLSNCVENQFEAPVLFYVLALFVIITKTADLLFVVMAWIFVLSRVAHATVFATSNYVPLRGQLFAVGLIDLLLMWVIFAFHIYAS